MTENPDLWLQGYQGLRGKGRVRSRQCDHWGSSPSSHSSPSFSPLADHSESLLVTKTKKPILTTLASIPLALTLSQS